MRKSPSKGLQYRSNQQLNKNKIAAFNFTYDKKEKKFEVINISHPNNNFKVVFKSDHLEVCAFIERLFENKIHVFGKQKVDYLMNLQMIPQTCGNCSMKTNLIKRISYSLNIENKNVQLGIFDLENLPKDHIDMINTEQFRKDYCMGEIRKHTDPNRTNRRYMNSCFYCESKQEDYFGIMQHNSKNIFVTKGILTSMPHGFPETLSLFLID